MIYKFAIYKNPTISEAQDKNHTKTSLRIKWDNPKTYKTIRCWEDTQHYIINYWGQSQDKDEVLK